MIATLVKISFGYALAAMVATAVALAQMPILFGGAPLSWKDSLGVFVIVAVFGWGGIPFAVLGELREWSRLLTYMGGGILVMAVGVASILGLTIVMGILRGFLTPEGKTIVSTVLNAAQLLALGVLPGAAAGLTYWAVAAPRAKTSAGNT